MSGLRAKRRWDGMHACPTEMRTAGAEETSLDLEGSGAKHHITRIRTLYALVSLCRFARASNDQTKGNYLLLPSLECYSRRSLSEDNSLFVPSFRDVQRPKIPKESSTMLLLIWSKTPHRTTRLYSLWRLSRQQICFGTHLHGRELQFKSKGRKGSRI